MSNTELASIFQELADMEEIEGNRWQSLAYGKVALSIATLVEDVEEIRKRNKLRNVDGVGPAIEKKIIEYINTGRVEKHRKLKEKYPVDFIGLGKIQGLGPKRIAMLYQQLGVRNIEELEASIKSGEVATLRGFGKKSEEALKKSLEVYKATGSNRLFLPLIIDNIQQFLREITASNQFVKADIAGSARRKRETVGDLDILAVCEDVHKCVEHFLSLDQIEDIVVQGETKVSVRLKQGINCDLRIVDASSYGSAMQYFTGSKEHNISMRDLAISRGLKLNEYGLFRDNQEKISGETEQHLYSKLGLDWIPPELRENMGEIEAAMNGVLPHLVEYSDVKGDLHSHTTESDGKSTIREMVDKARSMEMEYLGITEHSMSLKVANGLDEKRFRKRNEEIDRINSGEGSFRVLKGVELEIRKDGSLDLPENLLREMDFVILALHQRVGDDVSENTERVVRAIDSGLGHALAHPTGRMIGSREPYALDYDRIFQACEENQVALEINGFPDRSDLPFDLVKRARSFKVKFTLGSDSHSTDHLRFLNSAVSIARRGWLEKKDVLNCLPYNEIMKK